MNFMAKLISHYSVAVYIYFLDKSKTKKFLILIKIFNENMS